VSNTFHNISKLIKMLTNSAFDEFTWIMKVLESCQNDSQIETTHKLFELYLKKWLPDMNSKHISTFHSNFEKGKKCKLVSFKRKEKSSLFNTSQFFLF
jgi:hypothetical protein